MPVFSTINMKYIFEIPFKLFWLSFNQTKLPWDKPDNDIGFTTLHLRFKISPLRIEKSYWGNIASRSLGSTK